MQNKSIFIKVLLIAIFIVIIWLLFFQKTEVPVGKEEVFLNPEKVFLIIDDGEEVESFEIEITKTITAFDLLENKAKELNLNLEVKNYDLGIFIESIKDKKNGDDGKYWIYYINEEMPMVAADKKEIYFGDKIEFKFEESSF